jgi:hypothetical protein
MTWTLTALAALAALVPTQGTTYRDSIGEDAAAPDIGRVVVAGTQEDQIVFQIGVLNRPLLTGDMGIEIVVDADRAAATGDRMLRFGLGAEYLITILSGTPRLLHWTNGAWRAEAPPSSTYSGGTASVVVPARGLGRSAAFAFAVSVGSGLVPEESGTIDVTNAHFDFAPDAGRGGWTYRRCRSPGAGVSWIDGTAFGRGRPADARVPAHGC